MECPSVKSSDDSQESLHALGTPRAMATTVDAEIWKHNISDGCHLQNDTVWFATVFHKCSYKHRILNSGWIYCAVLIMWLHQRSSSNMEPWLASKVFLWPTILKQKLELWRHLSQVLLFTSDFHREQAWEKWVRDKKHGLSSEDAEWLLDHAAPCLCMGAFSWSLFEGTTRSPLQASHECPQKLKSVEEEWRCVYIG